MKIARISVLCLALGLGAVGCESGYDSTPESQVDLDISSTHKNLVVGEIATITARVHDTYGRNADVEWTSTGGDIDTEQNGRTARVTFDRPGTYTVTAALKVDGREVRRDSVEIRVRPLS